MDWEPAGEGPEPGLGTTSASAFLLWDLALALCNGNILELPRATVKMLPCVARGYKGGVLCWDAEGSQAGLAIINMK